ncbi:Alcohol dehydrogenase [Aquisphaera giovannonii]|uniref:Alcohol dehydrogenase n=1 Tax=Aquisphaera giovannonii TaxID=406548 RepID=A0A5B9VZQ3_9BACT|nr:NAD(P)-dependent alcohol dehydrogenase [Aquisphaera giovannonii]QEH33469.1 Alcohol dehydrogenase [Aquisphaera giovannonii]
MRAFRLHAFDGPDGYRLEERPSPSPGHGEVVVRMKAASLNYRDLLISKGLYNPKLPLPQVPLSDGAGEVAAVGLGVTRFKLGDRVSANFMAGWIEGPIDAAKGRTALGGEAGGVLAEEVVLPEAALVRIPDHLGFEEAATLPCAALTAWHALFPSGRVKPGDAVLTQGSGGVSVFAIQFASLAGARVIATSSSDTKLSRLKDLGASELINYKTTPDWDRRARELTGGAGVDHVIEVGGAGTLPKSLRAVRVGGHVALIGVLSGLGEVNPMGILMNSIRVHGIYVGSRDMFEAMNRAISAASLRPVIDRVFPFEDAASALRHLETGSHLGKVVIRIP